MKDALRILRSHGYADRDNRNTQQKPQRESISENFSRLKGIRPPIEGIKPHDPWAQPVSKHIIAEDQDHDEQGK